MSGEKQIEEISKILCGMKNGCDGCMFNKVHCNERNYAEEIYNAGYRKQSEGEWITETGDWIYNVPKTYCSKCGTSARYDKHLHEHILTNFCPNCGAKMKGGGE